MNSFIKYKRITAILLCIIFLCNLVTPVYAADNKKERAADYKMISAAIEDVSGQLMKKSAQPKPGSVGGEWLILGLARSGVKVPDSYYKSYYNALQNSVKQKKGILHQRKYSEYSRTILALTAIGKNPSNVGGYNLLTPLGDYKAVVQQGLNGAVFALLALDSGDYKMPVNKSAKVKATRSLYVNYILGKELAGGGWAVSGTSADADMTAMVLQALAPYRDNKKVNAAVDRGIKKLSAMQNSQGGFTAYGVTSCESAAQVLVALTTLGIDWNDDRFVKNQNSVVDYLMRHYQKGQGFTHTAGGKVDAMATEQALYALVAAKRFYNGSNSLYDMTVEPANVKKRGNRNV